MKKLWNLLKNLFSGNKEFVIQAFSIKNSQIGNFAPHNSFIKVDNKESVIEFSNQLVKFLENNCLVDVNNDKFKYFVNDSLVILKLNDSQTKRYILKELLYRKFSGSEYKTDDSDAPLTIALEAMKYMSETSLKHLCSYRLIINTLPSIFESDKTDLIPSVIKFINQNGLMDQTEIMNLRRYGLIFGMDSHVYSTDEVASRPDIQCIIRIIQPTDSLLYSNALSPAGIIMTDMLLEFFLGIHNMNLNWLQIKNKSLHLNGLVVDEDVMVFKNMIVQGDTSSGGGQ